MENNNGAAAPAPAQTLDTSRIDKLRWISVFLQMLVGSAMAYVYCVSVYVGPLAEEFGWNPSVIVVAYTAMTIVGLPGSAVGGKMKEKLGNKTTMKIGGVCFGLCVIGSSFAVNAWMFVILFGCMASFFMYAVYVVQLANIGELFPDKRGFSLGVTIAGITVGSAMISPFSEWLVRQMDVMNTVALQGAAYGILVLVAGFLIVDAPKGYCPKNYKPAEFTNEDGETTTGAQDLGWIDSLKMPGFWIFLLSTICGGVVMAGFQGNAILLMQDTIGVNAATAAWLYSFWLIVVGAAGMVLGYMSDKWTGPLKTIAIWNIVFAAALVLYFVTGSDEYWAFLIVIFTFGLQGGATQALMPTFVMDAFGGRQFGIIFGIILACVSIGGVIGPQITTRFSGDQFFAIAIVLIAACAALILIAVPLINKAIGKKLF